MKIMILLFVIASGVLMNAGWWCFCFAVPRKPRPLPFLQKKSGEDDKVRKELHELHMQSKEKALKIPRKQVQIQSEDGLRLNGWYHACEHPHCIVLCAHGYRASSYSDFGEMVPYLHAMGCDVLLIDERACGESEGDAITFGAKEKKDVLLWTQWLAGNSELPVFLYGVSMGASTVLMTSELYLPGQVCGIIADCGYSSMKAEFSDLAKRVMHVPSFPLVQIVGFWCRVKANFSMSEADASKALAHAGIPVLLIHGTADTFVLPENTSRNADACCSDHEVLMVEGAAHAMSVYKDPERYREAVHRFIAENE